MICSTEGDLGDATYLLNILKNLPNGPHTLLLQSSTATKVRGPEGVVQFSRIFAPLANAQPYIQDCRIHQRGDQVDWASAGFRMASYEHGQTLLRAHVNHLVKVHKIGNEIDGKDQWITVDPSPETKGKIVINRTGRYRNETFAWDEVVRHYNHRLVFVGLQHEWREFIAHFGYVDFRPTDNLLQVAQLIAGSELFIGNQSCANACAEGMKHPLIQETSTVHPDCIYVRDNAQHVDTGECILPDIQGSGVRHVEARAKVSCNIITHTTPPGQWQFRGITAPIWQMLVDRVKVNWPEVTEDEIKRDNLERVPEFFVGDSLRQRFARVEKAKTTAGYAPRTYKEMLAH